MAAFFAGSATCSEVAFFAALAVDFFAGASVVADPSAVLALASAGVAAAFLAAAFFTGARGTTLSTSIVMWQVRLRIRYARPCARGRNRLSVGPSSTKAALISSESGSSRSLFSAFATALATTL